MDRFGIDDLSQNLCVTDRSDAQEAGFSGTAQRLERRDDFVTDLRDAERFAAASWVIGLCRWKISI